MTLESAESKSPATVAHALDEFLSALANFEALLDKEHSALMQRDTETLELLVTEKLALADRLQDYHGILDDHLPQGSDSDPHRTKSAPADHNPINEAYQHLSGVERQALTALIERCHKKNLINGAIIESGLKVNRDLCDLIRGHEPNQAIYGHNGLERNAASSSSLTLV